MSRSTPSVLERPGTVHEAASPPQRDTTASPTAPDAPDAPASRSRAAALASALGSGSSRLMAGRRLPQPPGRRAPLWFAALVAGALLAMLPSLVGSPAAVTSDASDYGLGAASDVDLTGGLDDAGVRRSITEAEAQARLGELAASRAARAPKTVVPVTSYRLTTCFCMRWGQMHPGWDMAAPIGTPIYSATDGVVLKAGRQSGFGNAVYIQDAEGNVHIYGHMRYYDVKAGQLVHAGDQIAKIGNEGYSTGPHLHWQIHRGGMDGRPIDPEVWLTDRKVTP